LVIVRRLAFISLWICAFAALGLADDASFRHVKVPTPKGQHINAVLTFSDRDKAVEVRPAKGEAVNIPYATIDKASYEYTTELTIGLSEAKNHWLRLDYHEQDAPKTFLLVMDKHNYLRILDALKSHTGIDAEILGNADKRHEKIWHKE
jgi:hypothetical protein